MKKLIHFSEVIQPTPHFT